MTYKIFRGSAKPMVAVGVHQCRLLRFAEEHQGWHSFQYDRDTLRAVNALERKGYLEVVRYQRDGQFRFKYA